MKKIFTGINEDDGYQRLNDQPDNEAPATQVALGGANPLFNLNS